MRVAIELLLAAVAGAALVSVPRLILHRAARDSGERAHTEATFEFTADAPIDKVAPLFGADRERVWAEDWSPRFAYPLPAADRAGMVFSVSHGHGESSVWVNTQFDPARGLVQYVYVLPDELTTLITLNVAPSGPRTHVVVSYARTALRSGANARVLKMGAKDRESGPEWEQQINDYLHKSGSATRSTR